MNIPELSLESPVTRLLLVDDHPGFRQGVAALLRSEGDLVICAEAASMAEGLRCAREHRPDVVLLDVSLPDGSGLELARQLAAEQPAVGVLMVSMHEESLYAMRGFHAGARGYLMKTSADEHLVEAVRAVRAGRIYVSAPLEKRLIFQTARRENPGALPTDSLSPREREVLRLLGHGRSTREIAEELAVSVKTVDTHRARIKEKLGAADGAEVVRFATEWVREQTVSPASAQ